MVKHPWPLLEISLSDFRGLATLNINTYLPTYTVNLSFAFSSSGKRLMAILIQYKNLEKIFPSGSSNDANR